MNRGIFIVSTHSNLAVAEINTQETRIFVLAFSPLSLTRAALFALNADVIKHTTFFSSEKHLFIRRHGTPSHKD